MNSARSLTLCLISCLLLASCGSDQAPPSSQVAATVNKREISVHQLNFAMQQRPDFASLGAGAPAKILDDLVTRELLVEAATKSKLDREPQVLLAIESARRDVLARVFLERATTPASKPNAEAVERFYAGRPELFKARRLYQVLEHDVEIAEDKLSAFDSQVSALKSPRDVARFISESRLPFNSAISTRAPEALPMEVAKQLHKLSEGQSLLVKQPKGVRVMTIISTMQAAVPESQARPVIESYLTNLERTRASEAQLKLLRDQATIVRSAAVTATAGTAPQPN